MVLIFLIVMFVLCLITREVFHTKIKRYPELKFFLAWLSLCFLLNYLISWGVAFYSLCIYLFIFCEMEGDSVGSSSSGSCGSYSSDSCSFDTYDDSSADYKIYENGTWRINNISNTGYYYSDGSESWNGMFGEEHRENETVYDNAFVPGRREIYSDGEYIGYEYEDLLGITHRIER